LARGQSVIALVEGRDPSVFGPPSCPYSPECVEGEFSEVGMQNAA
jgi:hypothetical protein